MCVCVYVCVCLCRYLRQKRRRLALEAQARVMQASPSVLSKFIYTCPVHCLLLLFVIIVVVVCHQRGSREWRRELAALVIQLAWRQHQRRQVLARALRRQRILHDWTPSVMAARQKALVQKVYSKSLHSLSRPFFRG